MFFIQKCGCHWRVSEMNIQEMTQQGSNKLFTHSEHIEHEPFSSFSSFIHIKLQSHLRTYFLSSSSCEGVRVEESQVKMGEISIIFYSSQKSAHWLSVKMKINYQEMNNENNNIPTSSPRTMKKYQLPLLLLLLVIHTANTGNVRGNK